MNIWLCHITGWEPLILSFPLQPCLRAGHSWKMRWVPSRPVWHLDGAVLGAGSQSGAATWLLLVQGQEPAPGASSMLAARVGFYSKLSGKSPMLWTGEQDGLSPDTGQGAAAAVWKSRLPNRGLPPAPSGVDSVSGIPDLGTEPEELIWPKSPAY